MLKRYPKDKGGLLSKKNQRYRVPLNVNVRTFLMYKQTLFHSQVVLASGIATYYFKVFKRSFRFACKNMISHCCGVLTLEWFARQRRNAQVFTVSPLGMANRFTNICRVASTACNGLSQMLVPTLKGYILIVEPGTNF